MTPGHALLQMTLALHDAIKESGSIPSGHLYAMVMAHMSLETYERLIGILIESGKVRKKSHLLEYVA